ncbi:MAG: hypothetical protein GKR87_05335 [Kiritimatiellae bacterium]|nr:hypothetical protein [Kiritimatiellia bacterium]
MIGEIHDLETADIAINASLTGHLVFSALDTNDAPSAIARLLDIGVKPFLVASSIRGIMAQRLVRSICETCREEYVPEKSELSLLGNASQQVKSVTMYRGTGCSQCGMSGYRGRIGIFEILVLNDEIWQMIFEDVSSTELRNKARQLGMRTLREDGIRKVIGGQTTVEEVLRVSARDLGL